MKFRKLNVRETYFAIVLIFIGLSMHIWGPDDALDIKFFYTAAQANAFLRGLSVSQSQAYLLNEAMDLLFLTTYSFLLYFLARRLDLRKPWLALIPGFFDLIETITIILLLRNGSFPPIWLGYATCLKWLTGALVFVSIIVGFVRRVKQANISAT